MSYSAFSQNTGGVFGSVVNEGHRSVQYRAAYAPELANGESGFAQRFHYQQAIDGDFMWRVVGQTRKTLESDTDFDYLQAEPFWQLGETKEYSNGVRFDLRYRDNDRPNQIGLNLMHQFNLENNLHYRLLLLTVLQTGDNAADGIILQTRVNIWKKRTSEYRLGTI